MYYGKKVIHIVAVAQNNVIGKDNDLCWRIKEDLQYFKQQTLGHVCLAGRKTVESFPKPLERRIVETASRKWGIFENFFTIEMLMDGCVASSNRLNTDKIFIIGGSQLYKSTEGIVDELWITEIKEDYEGDTHYVKPEGFSIYDTTDWVFGLDSKNQKTVQYRFTKWKKGQLL